MSGSLPGLWEIPQQVSVPNITAIAGIWTNKWAIIMYQDNQWWGKPREHTVRGPYSDQWVKSKEESAGERITLETGRSVWGRTKEKDLVQQGPECGSKGLEKPQMRHQRNRQGWDCTVWRRQSLILKATEANKGWWFFFFFLILTGRHFISLLF